MLKSLSTNEWLGDPATHLMKSGNAIRSKFNDDLKKVAPHIPKFHRGVPVEYDITYESRPDKISGYKFTDFLTKCVWISPASSRYSREHLSKIAARTPTDYGRSLVEKLALDLVDKYYLRRINISNIDQLIVLPGSNILNRRVLDEKLLANAVRSGAKIKMHPLTSKLDAIHLTRIYGKENILDSNSQLYPLLKMANHVYFPASSESGIACILLGKETTVIDTLGLKGQSKPPPTFHAIYYALRYADTNAPMIDRLAALFEYPDSGLLLSYHSDIEYRIQKFFESFSNVEHFR